MDRERKQKIEDAMRVLIDEVNGGSPLDLADVMVDHLTRTHRTLQQEFMSAIRLMIYKYGNLDEVWTDLRNASAWEWAKEVSKMTDANRRFPL